MSKSIADGARLSPESFADFVERLKYHNRGDGVNWHHTADPIFMVQKHTIIYGLDDDFCDGKFVAFEDGTCFSPEEYWDDLDDEGRAELNKFCLDSCDKEFTELDEDAQWGILSDQDEHTVSGYKKEWQYVNVQLTREAAEAFIRRKKHNYPPLRVYVESMCYGWEYQEIIQALCDGRLVLSDKEASND